MQVLINHIKIAIVQDSPIYNNLGESVNKAIEIINLCSSNNVDLIVFGESWLTGYPFWLDYSNEAANWNNENIMELYRKTYNNSLDLQSDEAAMIQKAAKDNNVYVVMGFNERTKKGYGNSSIFNSFIFIDRIGNIVNHHRKLVPTYNEKLIYTMGDGFGLKTVETEFGRIGALICWEHWMPLTRQALHNEGEIIHIALWPQVHDVHQLASRHYAFESRTFTIAAGQFAKLSDYPPELSMPNNLKNIGDEMIMKGGSCVIGPQSDFIINPCFNEPAIVYCEIDDLNSVIKHRHNLDVSGNYFRPDIFSFDVNNKRY